MGVSAGCREDPLGGGGVTTAAGVSGAEGKLAEEADWFGIGAPDDDNPGSAG